MDPSTIDLVKESWKKVIPISETAAELFYGKLFELDPSVKPLFKGDMKEQGKKLMSILNITVNTLDKPETITPVIQDMGRRHIDYGVTDKHYDTVGEALIWTLSAGLKDDFTNEVRNAWIAVYKFVADTMKAS